MSNERSLTRSLSFLWWFYGNGALLYAFEGDENLMSVYLYLANVCFNFGDLKI